jgi:uncharacterized protein YjbI with pentapeptide repeats
MWLHRLKQRKRKIVDPTKVVEGNCHTAQAELKKEEPLPPIVAKADDLEAIRQTVEDAASVSAGLWISYLFVVFYLGIATGGVTHVDILLENPVKLPFLNIELPLLAFFVLGPIIFILCHAYTLVHFVLLANKAKRFHSELARQIPDSHQNPNARDIREALRRQLPSNLFVQFLAGPDDVRESGFGFLLKTIAWNSLVVGPIALVLLFQIQFLPYHDLRITWIHRAALLIDLILIWWLWRKILVGRGDPPTSFSWKPWVKNGTAFVASVFIIVFSWNVATTPDEWQEDHLPSLKIVPTQWQPIWALPSAAAGWLQIALTPSQPVKAVRNDRTGGRSNLVSLQTLLFSGEVDPVTRRRTSLWSNTIVLPGFDIFEALKINDPQKVDWKPFLISLRGRHLEGAVLAGATLKRTDFSGAYLGGASLGETQLQGSSFATTALERANFDGAVLQNANFLNARLKQASLWKADLRNADLSNAHLQGAELSGADLRDANLVASELQGARFDGAELEGARLSGANLVGASLIEAYMQGADVQAARLQAASLARAFLQAANFAGAYLQGADLSGAELEGASLDDAALQGASFTNANIDATSLLGVSVWRADVRAAKGKDRARVSLLKAELSEPVCRSKIKNRKWCWSVEDLEELKQLISSEIPNGPYRDEALRRIEKGLNPNQPLLGEDAIAHDWVALANAPPPHDQYEKNVSEVWRVAGCANDDGAPYVVRAVTRFMIRAYRNPAAMMALKSVQTTNLAKIFLDKQLCRNQVPLSDDTRTALKSIADAAPLGAPGFSDCVAFSANQALPAKLGTFTFVTQGGAPIANAQGRVELGAGDITVGFGPVQELLFEFFSYITKTVTMTRISNGSSLPTDTHTVKSITILTPNTENVQSIKIHGDKDTWLETICRAQ